MRNIRSLMGFAVLVLFCFPVLTYGKNLPPSKKEVLSKLQDISVPFVANEGQVNREVAFYAKTFSGTVFVTRRGSIGYALPMGEYISVVREEIAGESHLMPKGETPSITKVSSFTSDDPSAWKGNIPTYKSVSLGEVSKGITLSLKAHGKNVEKVFTVSPGVSPSIPIKLSGIKDLNLTDSGELEVVTEKGSFAFTKPMAYQEVDGKKVEIPVAYMLPGDDSEFPVRSSQADVEGQGLAHNVEHRMLNIEHLYSFALGSYDTTRPLVIDPLLASTFWGGRGRDGVQGIAVDSSGNVYVAGHSNSDDFPVTKGAYNTAAWVNNGFISKLDGNLTTLIASTRFLNSIQFLALDSSDNIYVAGWTGPGLPTTNGAYCREFKGYDEMFVAKFDNSLTHLIASTYLGGSNSDHIRGFSVDPSGDIYVVGGTLSPDFPTTKESYSPTCVNNYDVHGFITKLNGDLTTLLASTYLWGSRHEMIYALAVDPSGNIYVGGQTWSPDFPTTKGAYNRVYNPDLWFSDAFISRFDSNLTTLLASTLIGGARSELIDALAVDPSGNIYAGGCANSDDFPTTEGAYSLINKGSINSFIAKMNGSLTTLLSSTYLGGSYSDQLSHLVLDPSGDVYAAGTAYSSDFPVSEKAFNRTLKGPRDVFISRLNGSLTSLLASTYLGGSGSEEPYSFVLDHSGNVYVTGWTGSADFPVTTTRTYGGEFSDGFIARLDPDLSATSYYITVSIGGNKKGTVTGPGLTCTNNICKGVYDIGSEVTITAVPKSPSVFEGWTGCPSPSGNTCHFTMDREGVATASFNPPPRITVSPIALGFGTIKVGKNSVAKKVTIRNTGGALTINPISIEGDSSSFIILNNDCASVLPIGTNCTMDIFFKPSSPGLKNAHMDIISNDPKRPKITVKMSGRGK